MNILHEKQLKVFQGMYFLDEPIAFAYFVRWHICSAITTAGHEITLMRPASYNKFCDLKNTVGQA